MKKNLLLGLALLFAGAMNAQVIFLGLSPANIAGGYEMTYGMPASDWANPDFGLPANSVTGDLVAYGADSTACTSATNAAAIAGKIAVVYRADCSFSSKVLKAEAAGAIACVIINNIPGAPIAMAGGTDGLLVNIPAIMLSQTDGATIMAEMQNGPVNVFIGNKEGYFANDLGIKASQILRPKYSSIPSALAATGNEYQVDLAAYGFNYGSADQTEVVLNAVITFNGNEIYNETSTSATIVSGDSILFSLPDFAPATWAEGYYKLMYSISSGTTDEYIFDDALESDFVISPTDLSYANIDETTMKPSGLTGLRAVSPVAQFSSCMTFKDANASLLAPKFISFSASKGADAIDPSLVGLDIMIQVIKYDDLFTDINDPGYTVPIGAPILMYEKIYQYTTDAAGVTVTAPFDNADVMALENDVRYMFCATTYDENVFLGHDATRDYTFNIDYYLQPMFPIEVAGDFDPRGFGPETVTGVTVGFIDAAKVSLNQEKLAIKMNAYPSPASDLLNVDFKSNEVNKVELVNMMGQTVVSQNVANNAETATMNVASVENGVYIVKVYLTNNMTHTMQVVVNH
ncbi:T9SS type A sorting domain-containing protein [Brumimicrobium glaciale]|uniref:T9SS type A sorting domain-containing protein n=1 Tax=Brumimicrobium glaciale TaxID=200475 RepID=A0A4Q4KPT5_9FLAO|nr:T9SS type A sorting domain-containing protein [Brumimicrobium glaciale]RYM34877.1 T9SS type A sorting domain-containing protein [Brumimicrobium glaciale]